MDYYDLSGDSLTEFPDLSRYVIRSLDLSYNRLLNPHYETFPHETDTILWEGSLTGNPQDVLTLHNTTSSYLTERDAVKYG